MVPIHRRKLAVQKAQEGKLFELPKPLINRPLPTDAVKPIEIPKSFFSREGVKQAMRSAPQNLLKGAGLRSPLGIGSLVIAGLSGTEDLVEQEKKKLLDLYDTRMFKGELDDLRRRRADEELNREAFDPNIPKVPGGAADTRRKQFEERDAMNQGDFMQFGQGNTPITPQNTNPVQAGVDGQKAAIAGANKKMSDLETQAAEQGKSTELQSIKNMVREIMGTEDYDRAGNLMLLQLASALLSGKTDQRGFTGFLDVLGQAGQKVIPLAIALDSERRKDEIDLTKAIITQMGARKKASISEPKFRVVVRDQITGDKKLLYASTTEDGNFLVSDIIGNKTQQYLVSPAQVENILDLKEDVKTKSEIQAQYNAIKVGSNLTRKFIEIGEKNPDLLAFKGGLKKLSAQVFDQAKQFTAGDSYEQDIRNLTTSLRNDGILAVDPTKGSLAPDLALEGEKYLQDNIWNKLEKNLENLTSTDEDIKLQALLESYSLLSTYALAQSLKDKDRLAVADIQRAERQLGNITSLTSLKSPKAILAQYAAINDHMNKKLIELRESAPGKGVKLSDLDAEIDRKFGFETQKDRIVKNTTKQNQGAFDQIFSKDALGDAILKWH